MTVDMREYRSRVKKLRKFAVKRNISNKKVDEIFEEGFRILEARYDIKEKNAKTKKGFPALKIVIFFIFVCCVGVYSHPRSRNFILRNIQDYIYPAMSIWRKLAIPVISRYPSLTKLYDEWCLIENPYFYVTDMDCSPCKSILSVPNLTGYNITKSHNIGQPFTRFEEKRKVNYKKLVELYINNQKVFDEDADTILSNNASYSIISDLKTKRLDLYPSLKRDTQISWRINRMNPARLVRQLFPRPPGTSDLWSQSVERFVFIDEPMAPFYILPNPECSNVIMRCTSGARVIKLIPSAECTEDCKPHSIILKAYHTLWYNWWYWRPVSLPLNSTKISINYLISFC